MKNESLKRFLAIAGGCFFSSFGAPASAGTIHFALPIIHNPSKIKGLTWEQGPFLLKSETQNGKLLHFIQLEGIFTPKNQDLVTSDSLSLEVKPLGTVENLEVRQVRLKVPIKAAQTHVTLWAIDATGKAGIQDFDLILEPEIRSFYEKKVYLSGVPWGSTSESIPSGGSTTTTFSGNVLRLGFDLSYFRAVSEAAKAWEYSGSISVGKITPLLGIQFPWLGTLSAQMAYRNLWHIAKKSYSVSPLFRLQYETLSTLSPLVRVPSLLPDPTLGYQARSLGFFWAGLGARLSPVESIQKWEVEMTLYHSLFAGSSLDVSGGSFSLWGWKGELYARRNLGKIFFGGIDLMGTFLSGDLQVTSYTSSIVFGIRL